MFWREPTTWHWCVLISVFLQYFEWLLLFVYDEIQITWNTLNAGSGHNFEGVFYCVGAKFLEEYFFQGLQVQEIENLYIFDQNVSFSTQICGTEWFDVYCIDFQT